MAEESNRRASIGAYHVGDSSRKDSIKTSDSAKSNRNVVPNYLRASTGSCHDFCKYGKKHSSEEKPKKPLQRIAKPSADELIMVSGEINKEKAVENQKSQADSKKPSFSPKPKISSEKKKVIKNKSLTDAKPTHSPDKTGQFRKPENPLDAKYKPVLLKAKPSLDELIMVSGDRNKEKAVENQKSLTDTKNPSISTKPKLSSRKKKVIKNQSLTDATKPHSPDKKARFQKPENPSEAKYKPILLKPKPLPDPPEIVKSVFFPSKKDEKMPSNSRPVKAKVLLSSSDNLDGVSEKGRKNGESGKGGNVKLMVSYPKDRNKARVVNKSVIEPVSSVESLSHQISSVLSSHKEVISKNESLEIIRKLPPVKENNHNKTPKKIVSEKNCENRTPVKLRFRNGKVMDVQSNSNVTNVPRKLRFRRARVIGADEIKSDLRIRMFKKAGLSDDKARVVASSEKVVLKHQDVKEKKDGQGLLNNDIIEQTASKLVASRKSKVKALVGAFETVISLQESKPSS